MNIQIKLKEKLEIGEQLINLGKISEAIEQYSLALELQPNCTDALIALANIYEKNQELDKAINYQEQVVKLMPKNSDAKVKLGSLMLAVGKAEEAIYYYQQVIAINPEQPAEIYSQLGSALNKIGKAKESIVAYQKALNISEKKLSYFRKQLRKKEEQKVVGNVETTGKLAQKLMQEGNITEAIETYQQALIIPGEKPAWIYRELADAYQKNAQGEKIETLYREAISVNIQEPYFYLKLAQIYSQQNRLEEATYEYEQVLFLNPNHLAALNQLGGIKKKMQKYQEAETYYQRLAKLNPKNPGVRLELGDVLTKQKKWEEATKAYHQVIDLKHKLSEAYLGLANVLMLKGDSLQQQEKSSEAIASYNQALDIPTNIHIEKQIHSKLMSIYLKQGKLEEAELSYQKSIINRYLINHKLKIIYCPIPKNACTMFNTIMVEHSDYAQQYKESSQDIHEYIGRLEVEMRLTDPSYMQNPDYFKFVILRNPFKRLVSAYLNLIVKRAKPISFAYKLVMDVYRDLGMEPDIYKSITFSQFINYLANTDNDRLNAHWRPQYTFLCLGRFQFDYIGQFENLNRVKKDLNQKSQLKIPENIFEYKRTNYSNYKFENKLHKKHPDELIKLIKKVGGFPKYEVFYTPELEVMVREKYAEDIKIYEREFNQVVEF
ncbi:MULTISPECIES: tetratricopeptide repeat protein [unclassified Okeania]|uniref:tetratricopeptide repeat protein n=1 Tax=unclassified Okeania TaxID=2634635 RepID=UPI0013BC312B|nr:MULTISPECIES: tetratricopeptide repeat protein [unclassified Okeania]NES78912.1 tetratricopeptide repeat protein [Okeania sp. SIO1H4]NET13659.1 tetratricopeptide repeat protein [Okeania sp. SIO1H6]NET22480.1 tetratricopeptide repeat protein [Okeania sp. SIO1H5]